MIWFEESGTEPLQNLNQAISIFNMSCLVHLNQ